MEGFRALEVYLAAAPAKAGQLPPAPPAPTLYAKGNRLAELDPARAEERTREGRVVLRFALGDLGADPEGHTGTFWGFVLVGPQGQRGAASEPKGFLASPPLPPVAGLRAEPEDEAVRLAFEPPPGATTLRVSRAVGGGPPVLLEDLAGDADHYADRAVRQGADYTYAVQAASAPDHWSDAAEVRLQYSDLFPPADPPLVQYLPLDGKAWVKVARAAGAAAYRVYRRCPGEDWSRLAEGPDPMFEVDASVCEFGAAAVDASGNQSAVVSAVREEP
jgi:hypothetical protein